MDVERLIEEVRKFPVLYDQGSENYRNIEYKDRVWKTIATDLQAKDGIEECKKKRASVRDQLRKTLQKRKTVSGQAAVHQHKYKYEDLLKFLLPYMVERETVSNGPYTQDNNEHKQESNTDSLEAQSIVENEKEPTQEDIADEEWIIKTQGSETENLVERNRHSYTSSAHSSVTSNKNTFMKPPLKRKFQREVKPQESASSQLMAYILAEKKVEKQREIQNQVDAFLAAQLEVIAAGARTAASTEEPGPGSPCPPLLCTKQIASRGLFLAGNIAAAIEPVMKARGGGHGQGRRLQDAQLHTPRSAA
ncbi:transcription factor Adf-1-like [Schistocerca piceifrons]|uniref:transcription factor Adf-1-like n=1 Tax=Schistocerca piceifrons TaxID=274613 RepID=UPI001F5F0403|nr:transcription factor Adf-1-like [Schistocerca piceifrons]